MFGLVDLFGYWVLVWLVFCFIGFVVIVFIVEELVFRVYLLCKFVWVDVIMWGDVLAYGNWFIVVSLVVIFLFVFGVLYGVWIVGIVVGVVYVLVRIWICYVGDVILVYVIINGLLCVYVVMIGEWFVL